MNKEFEALILVNGKMLTDFKGKAKNANAVRWLVFENFDDAEIIDLHWLWIPSLSIDLKSTSIYNKGVIR